MTKELPVLHHHHLFRNKEEPTNKQSTKTKKINKRIACPTPWRIICGGEYLYIHKENKSIWPILITQNVRYSWIQIVWTYICLISCHFMNKTYDILESQFLCISMFALLTEVCQDRPTIDKTANLFQQNNRPNSIWKVFNHTLIVLSFCLYGSALSDYDLIASAACWLQFHILGG